MILAIVSSSNIFGMENKKQYSMNPDEQRVLKFIAFGSNGSQVSRVGSYNFLKDYILKECKAPTNANTLYDLSEMNSLENAEWIKNNSENCKNTVQFIMKALGVEAAPKI